MLRLGWTAVWKSRVGKVWSSAECSITRNCEQEYRSRNSTKKQRTTFNCLHSDAPGEQSKALNGEHNLLSVCLSVFFLRGSKQDCRCVAPEWAVRASLGWAPSFPSTVSSAPVSRELSPGSTPVAWLSEKITSWQVLTPYLYLVKVFIMFPADTDGEERVVLLLACLSDKSQWLFTNSWVAVGYQYIPFCFFTASPVPAGRQVSSVQRFLRSWLAYLLFIFITLILIFF